MVYLDYSKTLNIIEFSVKNKRRLYMDYVQKLEGYFHKDFLAMDVNTECKAVNIVSYVRMLEEMVSERGIIVEKEDYDTTENHILIEDKSGDTHRWVVDVEHPTYFEVRHMNAVTFVGKDRIIDRKCDYKIDIPKGSTRNSLTYLYDTGNINQLENELLDEVDA
jgi:hypothetical protein